MAYESDALRVTVLELGRPRSWHCGFGVRWKPVSRFLTVLPAVTSHGRRGAGPLWGPSIRALIPFMWTAPSWPNYLLWIPPPPPPRWGSGCIKDLGGGAESFTAQPSTPGERATSGAGVGRAGRGAAAIPAGGDTTERAHGEHRGI